MNKEAELDNSTDDIALPYPIDHGSELIDYCLSNKLSIANVVFENGKAFRPEKKIDEEIEDIFDTMLECVYTGCTTDGILPGGLNVKRRAQAMAQSLLISACGYQLPSAQVELY